MMEVKSSLASVPKANLAKPKYVPIRPFRPLLPKPSPIVATTADTARQQQYQPHQQKIKPNQPSKVTKTKKAPSAPKQKKQMLNKKSPNNEINNVSNDSTTIMKKPKKPSKKALLKQEQKQLQLKDELKSQQQQPPMTISSISPASLTESLSSPEPEPLSAVISIGTKAAGPNSGTSDSTWATDTANEILAASITEDFFWLSPKSFVSEPSSIVINDSLSLDFQAGDDDDEEDYFSMGSSSVTSTTTIGDDDDHVKPRLNDYDNDLNNNKIILNAAAADSDSGMLKNFSPEPFCSFELSPESVFDNDDDVNDPYGFLDLAINI
jgi:hypothetical protein